MSDDVQDGAYVQCVAGHFFDSRRRQVCPVCGAGPAVVSGSEVRAAASAPPETLPASVPPVQSSPGAEPHPVPGPVLVSTPVPAAATGPAAQTSAPSPNVPFTAPANPVAPGENTGQTLQDKLTRCPNGHLYDPNTDSTCPKCEAASTGGSRSAVFLYIVAAVALAITVCIIVWPHLKSPTGGPSQDPVNSNRLAASLPVIETFDAVPAEINSGDAATLRWSTSNASQIEIDHGVGIVIGQQTLVRPSTTTLYTLTASGGQGNSTARSVLITVRPKSTPVPAIDAFTVQPETIDKGQSAVLRWSVQNASSVSIDNGVGSTPGNQARVRPDSTTTYTLTAADSGASVTRTVTLHVNAPPPPRAVILAFTATPERIVSGQSAVLHWTARNATALSIDNSVGSVAGDQVSVHPTTTTTYTLAATGEANSDTRSVVVTVAEPAPIVRTQPQSGLLRCQNVTVAPFGQVVFDNLPGARLHFNVEPAGAWLILPQKQPDGTQKLILISRSSQPQTACTVHWEIVK